MSDTLEQLTRMASDEALDITKSLTVIAGACSAVRYAGDTLRSELAKLDLNIPENPVVVDAKKYYGVPQDTNPLVELDMVWHGYESFWVPRNHNYDRRRQRPCFRRLVALAPELVDFVDSRIPALASDKEIYRPDRLSVSLPLIASLDLLSKYLISPKDPDVFTADGTPRHNYLV